jgi:hypothetical protein
VRSLLVFSASNNSLQLEPSWIIQQFSLYGSIQLIQPRGNENFRENLGESKYFRENLQKAPLFFAIFVYSLKEFLQKCENDFRENAKTNISIQP